ncbi:CSON015143 protein, partial [Gryllus bimaculatus]
MLASAKLDADVLPCGDPDAVVGFEFSGRLSSGRRVMGMRMGGCVSTEIMAPDYLLWDVPDEMTLLEASTIPVAYGTVVYALEMVGRMAAGESVLVHAASGAVGQAA